MATSKNSSYTGRLGARKKKKKNGVSKTSKTKRRKY